MDRDIHEKVLDILYNSDDGLMYRLRDEQGPMTKEEKEVLKEFSKKVNKDLIEDKVDIDELLTVFDILSSFGLYDETREFSIVLYQNLSKNF